MKKNEWFLDYSFFFSYKCIRFKDYNSDMDHNPYL